MQIFSNDNVLIINKTPNFIFSYLNYFFLQKKFLEKNFSSLKTNSNTNFEKYGIIERRKLHHGCYIKKYFGNLKEIRIIKLNLNKCFQN